jgi:hypothetical protein
MLEETLSLSTPHGVAVDFISYEENDAYDKALKGSIHAIILPLMIGFIFGSAVGIAYFFTAAVLYGTVFRHKSQGFWSVVMLIIGIGALMLIGGIQ